MIKYKYLYLVLLLGLNPTTGLFAQLHDNNWVVGPAYLSKLDFSTSPPTQSYIVDTLAIFETNACISDRNGNFLFFTNGIYVANKNGGKMPHGDSLSFYNYQNNYDIVYPNGMPQTQGAIILPRPNDSSKYVLFHYSPVDTYFSVASRGYNVPRNFYYSIVDMEADSGFGDVVKKNIRLPWNGLECASRMTAVKHANGRDWWVIRHGWRDSTYVTFLLTPDTIEGPYFQKIGDPFNINGMVIDYYGGSVFNLEGTKMATGSFWGPVVILDFDRCSGHFSNPISIHNSLVDTTLPGITGLAFSPNGRFLYLNNIYELNQYDLWASDPNDSVRLYTVDSTDIYYMNSLRLGPDGKIYIGTWHGGNYALHVINNPDLPGLACQFQLEGLACPISANTNNLPNMVNYKLGALVGSGCDTIVNAIGETTSDIQEAIQISPNPASNKIQISSSAFTGSCQVMVYNSIGQQVKETMVSLPAELDVSDMPSGVYQVCFRQSNMLQQSVRLVVSK